MKIQSPTWKDVIADALEELGGEAHIKEIAAVAAKHPKAANNSHVEEKVRQVVRAYSLFESVEDGSGQYRLLQSNLELPIVGLPTTKEITDEIQGKLLYIGLANGFDTYAPADDQTKRVFEGKPLRDLVTLPDGLDAFDRFKDAEKKVIKLIDVLWFREEDDDLIPHCAFEVEHSTNVLTGLERLNHLPKVFQTSLFIVGRDEPKKAKFDALMQSPTWKKNAGRFKFRFFEDVHNVFNHASSYRKAREANKDAMEHFVG